MSWFIPCTPTYMHTGYSHGVVPQETCSGRRLRHGLARRVKWRRNFLIRWEFSQLNAESLKSIYSSLIALWIDLQINKYKQLWNFAGGSALCDSSTGVTCTSDAGCVTICKQRAGQNYVNGYCSPEPNNAVGGGRSCVCVERCGAQPTPLEKPATATTPARMGMLDWLFFFC